MATNNNSNRYPSEKEERFFKGKTFILLIGLLLGAGIMVAVYKTSVYFSSDESCMMCHVHPHAEDSWKLSKHVNNGSGVKTHCVACHLPPQSDTWNHYTAKAKLGLKDVWSFMTKDSADFDWNTKSELEHAVKYIPNESCKECHQNLFPEGITQDGITAHLYYDENEKKLDLQCISCHLDAGHYNPDYKHGKLAGVPGLPQPLLIPASISRRLLPSHLLTIIRNKFRVRPLHSKWLPFQAVHSKWVVPIKNRSTKPMKLRSETLRSVRSLWRKLKSRGINIGRSTDKP